MYEKHDFHFTSRSVDIPSQVLGAGRAEKALPDAPSSQTAPKASGDISEIDERAVDPPSSSVPIDPSPARRAPATAAEFRLSPRELAEVEAFFSRSAA